MVHWEHTYGMDKNLFFLPKYTEKQKLNNVFNHRARRTKGDIFMTTGEWDRSGNVTMETSRRWGKPQHELSSCPPSWMTEPKPRAFPFPGPLPPRALLTRYAGQRPGRKWAQQGACALPLRSNSTLQSRTAWVWKPQCIRHFFTLKMQSEMLWAPICGWFSVILGEATSPPADGSSHGMSLGGYMDITAWDGPSFTVPKDPAVPSCQPFLQFFMKFFSI